MLLHDVNPTPADQLGSSGFLRARMRQPRPAPSLYAVHLTAGSQTQNCKINHDSDVDWLKSTMTRSLTRWCSAAAAPEPSQLARPTPASAGLLLPLPLATHAGLPADLRLCIKPSPATYCTAAGSTRAESPPALASNHCIGSLTAKSPPPQPSPDAAIALLSRPTPRASALSAVPPPCRCGKPPSPSCFVSAEDSVELPV